MSSSTASRSASLKGSTSMAGQVLAAQDVVVLAQVAQEVELLERRAEPLGTGGEPVVLDVAVARPASSVRKTRRHISPTTSAEP